ncbi:MAG: hypothetical protein LM560_05655 [Desulfurococcaceae archaeon]|nr:hypothetical protein [Desulfurococcaceae archaeon]
MVNPVGFKDFLSKESLNLLRRIIITDNIVAGLNTSTSNDVDAITTTHHLLT